MSEKYRLPDSKAIIEEALSTVEPRLRPALLAMLARYSAGRYRSWANEADEPDVYVGLLECARRDEVIASYVESLYPDPEAAQEEICRSDPLLKRYQLGRFSDRPREEQLEIQASGHRLCERAWLSYIDEIGHPDSGEVLRSCSILERASAVYLEELLATYRKRHEEKQFQEPIDSEDSNQKIKK